MQLNNLTTTQEKSKKRIGRGLGSGKGKTGGRGQKGQKARNKVKLGFTGGGLPLYRKLPLRRGWGNPNRSVKPVTLSLDVLAKLNIDGPINLEALVAQKVITEKQAKTNGVKLLGVGEISKKVTISGILVSAAAKSKIEAAGGQVE